MVSCGGCCLKSASWVIALASCYWWGCLRLMVVGAYVFGVVVALFGLLVGGGVLVYLCLCRSFKFMMFVCGFLWL